MLRPFLAGVGLALGALGAVAGLALAPRLDPPAWLTVNTVIVEGTDRARPVEVRHLADLHRGKAIWSVSARAVAEAAERHPWVRSAEVDVAWPGRVEIRVREHEIAGILLDRERWVYVNPQGVAFRSADDLDFPVLTGMGRTLDRIHPDLGRLSRRRAIAIVEALTQGEVVSSRDISEIAFAANVGYVVHTRGATLLFGLEEIERQVHRLGKVLAMGVSLEQRVTIDLSPEHVALVRPTEGRYPTVHNDFRSPGAGPVARFVSRSTYRGPQ